MKRLLLILLSLCLIIGCFAGCSHKEEPKVTDEVTQSTEEPKPVFPELEYTDVSAVMLGSYLGKAPEECLMIGNNVAEDMVAAEVGVKTYLVTGFVENPANADTSVFEQGTLEDFYETVQGWCDV